MRSDIESAVRWINQRNAITAQRAEAGAWIAVVIVAGLLLAVVLARCAV